MNSNYKVTTQLNKTGQRRKVLSITPLMYGMKSGDTNAKQFIVSTFRFQECDHTLGSVQNLEKGNSAIRVLGPCKISVLLPPQKYQTLTTNRGSFTNKFSVRIRKWGWFPMNVGVKTTNQPRTLLMEMVSKANATHFALYPKHVCGRVRTQHSVAYVHSQRPIGKRTRKR